MYVMTDEGWNGSWLKNGIRLSESKQGICLSLDYDCPDSMNFQLYLKMICKPYYDSLAKSAKSYHLVIYDLQPL